MKALVYDGALRLDRHFPDPTPGVGEALVSVTLAGICNTDLEITRGYADFKGVLGHEFIGVVVDAPSGQLIGRRVVGEINCVCGECAMCRDGLASHCARRTVLGIAGRNGALAELVILPERNLHIVPDNVTDEEAVFTEPLAAALQIAVQIHLRPMQTVAVLGDGKLGLLVAQALSLSGSSVTAFGHHPKKLQVLADIGIPTHLTDDLPSTSFDVVVECTGRREGLLLARRFVRPRGTIVLKSTFAGHAEFPFSQLVVDEVSIIGSRCGPFEPALRLLQRRLISIEPMITAVHSLDDAEKAFQRAVDRESLKVLVRPT